VSGALTGNQLPAAGRRSSPDGEEGPPAWKLPAGKKEGPTARHRQVAGNGGSSRLRHRQVRVYVLDDDFKPIAVGSARSAPASASTQLRGRRSPGSRAQRPLLHWQQQLVGKSDPVKLTVVLYREEEPEPVVVLCGWTQPR
jgi:hypothetical protein